MSVFCFFFFQCSSFKKFLCITYIKLLYLSKPKNFNKTSLGKTVCLCNPYFLLTGCLSIKFFNSPPIPTHSVRLTLVTYPSLCSICGTYMTPFHSHGHQVLPTQSQPREAEDFPRGGNHSEHVPLLTYLA